MEMSYYFSGTVYNFLFSGVNVVTTWGMVSLCMGLASLSLLSEGFSVARSLLLKVATSSRDSGCNRYNFNERVKFHILQTFFHVIQLTIGYLLMLAVMTYNAYFTVAVVGGAGLGYFCFALFDLPSRFLGTLTSRPAKWPAGTSPLHLSEAISLKQATENGNECTANPGLTIHLTSVLENGPETGEMMKCGQNSCDKKKLLQTTGSLIQATDVQEES